MVLPVWEPGEADVLELWSFEEPVLELVLGVVDELLELVDCATAAMVNTTKSRATSKESFFIRISEAKGCWGRCQWPRKLFAGIESCRPELRVGAAIAAFVVPNWSMLLIALGVRRGAQLRCYNQGLASCLLRNLKLHANV